MLETFSHYILILNTKLFCQSTVILGSSLAQYTNDSIELMSLVLTVETLSCCGRITSQRHRLLKLLGQINKLRVCNNVLETEVAKYLNANLT